MIIEIRNESIKILINSLGAEMLSMKLISDETEYLWQSDDKFWARHAPVLFPIVGKLKDNKYYVQDKEYSLGQHGFARDSEFELVERENNRVVFKLYNNELIQQKYPYQFELFIEYKLFDNSVYIRQIIKNTDNKKIWFSIGNHPGFNCPINNGEKFEDYYIEFEKAEASNRYFLEDGLFSGKIEPFLRDGKTLALSYDLFKDDAIILKDIKSREVSLKSEKSNRKVVVKFDDFKYLGLWSKPGASFVCIEPWLGLADSKESNGKIEDKEGIMSLEEGRQIECKYSIEIR